MKYFAPDESPLGPGSYAIRRMYSGEIDHYWVPKNVTKDAIQDELENVKCTRKDFLFGLISWRAIHQGLELNTWVTEDEPWYDTKPKK